MKIPIPSTTQIERISQSIATSIDSFAGLLKNVTVEMVEGAPRATRRLGIKLMANGDASDESISPTFGRGIHWPESSPADGSTYIANYNTVYRTSGYTSSLGTFGAGVTLQQNQKMFFASVDDGTFDTIVVDPVTNDAAGLTYDGTFTAIGPTGTDVLPTIVNAGVVWLNGRAFICGNNKIYNSTLNNIATGYTDFVSAERESDTIKAIVKHHDHIVALGVSTTEYFYHAENPGASGSPLRRRQDVYHKVGLLDNSAFDSHNDVIYFLGQGAKEGIGLYKIENFQLSMISDARFNRWINNGRSTVSSLNYVCAFPYEGRTLIAVTHADVTGATQTDLDDDLHTFIFETDGRSYVWDTSGIGELSNFPLVGATNTDGRVAGGGSSAGGTETGFQGIMANGDIFTFRERYDSPDTFKDNLGLAGAFTSIIQFNDFDGDTTAWKFCHSAEPYGSYETDCDFTLDWSDEGGAFGSTRTLTKANRQRAVSCGRFSRRVFRLITTDTNAVADEHMELEGLDADIELGSY